MSSSNYKIQSDSLNFGGTRSASGSYTMEDTMGETATGFASSTNYGVSAGFQQMDNSYLSVTPASSVALAPSIGGLTGGTSTGSTSFIVTTNDPAGYTATIAASSSPALMSGSNSFSDYAPAGSNPDFAFVNSPSNSSFGFSPEGNDIDARFKNDGVSACHTGSNTSGACWDGLSTSPKTILTRNSPNDPSGTLTTVRFEAVSGSSHIQPDGTYYATSTITIVSL